jgi:adenosylcobinamide-phosphate synthase
LGFCNIAPLRYHFFAMNFKKLVLPIALGIDILIGDPPNRYHPVAWMGSLISWLRRYSPKNGEREKFLFGTILTLGGASLVVAIGSFLTWVLERLPFPLGSILEAALLKATFSLRGLDRAAGEVQVALERDNLPKARRLVSWHLVSRDTSQLSASQVAAATIESVAENASDSTVAPLFFYSLGGLPAALAYRFANTADAMLGYRDAEREWLGKFPARFDDLLNFIPARLTGLLIVLAAKITGDPSSRTREIMRRDARSTESPNAGYPMSAMAGALGVELEKEGQYTLGAGLRPPNPQDIQRSRTLLMLTVGMAAALFYVFRKLTKDE